MRTGEGCGTRSIWGSSLGGGPCSLSALCALGDTLPHESLPIAGRCLLRQALLAGSAP